RPTAEGDRIQRAQLEPGASEQVLDGRDQGRRGLRATRGRVLQHPTGGAGADGDGQHLGAGVEGEEFHAAHRHYRSLRLPIMARMLRWIRFATCLLFLQACAAWGQALPPEVEAALDAQGLPRDAVT